MAVSYDKVSYPNIENALRGIIDDEFDNVYVSPEFEMVGNECIRINLLKSDNIETHAFYERRSYDLSIRYYFSANMSKPSNNEAVKNKIDRLKRHLIDNQNKEVSNGAKWVELTIDSIEYDVKDDENESTPEIYIAEFDVTIINHNPFGDE